MKTNEDNAAKLESLMVDEFDKQVRELALNRLAPRPGERVLVIGFGTGHTKAEIAQAVGPRGKALGFDLSTRGSRRSRDKVVLPQKANSLDGILTTYTLERFTAPPLPAVLHECQRVLRPGGRIVVIARKQEPDSDRVSLRETLSAAGFTVTQVEVMRLWAPIEIESAVKEGDGVTSHCQDGCAHQPSIVQAVPS